MSDFSQTVSCERLPQRMAARMLRSPLISPTRESSAAANFCWTVIDLPLSFVVSSSAPVARLGDESGFSGVIAGFIYQTFQAGRARRRLIRLPALWRGLHQNVG